MTTGPADHSPARPLRIACYGYAEPNAGSVSSAGYLILQELFRLPVEIDFYNKSTFVRPRGLESSPNYRFIDVPNPRTERLADRMKSLGAPGRLVGSRLVHHTFARGIIRAMRDEHQRRPYDVQLWLGDWAWGRIGVPVVSWVQGPPETDSSSILRHREELIPMIGRRRYIALRSYALFRRTIGKPPFKMSDVFVVGSQWSRQKLSEFGVDARKIHALPYPTDLDRFSPCLSLESLHPPTVLWFGRTVPRKRLDLFLDACAALIRSGIRLNVRIVGGFGFVPQYRQLIERFPYRDSLKYDEFVPRDRLPPLIREAAIVVQPSEHENFGSTVSEALACGTPVVLGSTNGTADYIGGGGVVFSDYSAESVAAAIRSVIDQRSRFSPLARQAAESNFRPESVAGRLHAILLEAIARRPSSSANAREPHD